MTQTLHNHADAFLAALVVMVFMAFVTWIAVRRIEAIVVRSVKTTSDIWHRYNEELYESVRRDVETSRSEVNEALGEVRAIVDVVNAMRRDEEGDHPHRRRTDYPLPRQSGEPGAPQ